MEFKKIGDEPIIVFDKDCNSDALVVVDALDAYINNHKKKIGQWRCDLSIKRIRKIQSYFVKCYNHPIKLKKEQ
jgi:hypothetical protein